MRKVRELLYKWKPLTNAHVVSLYTNKVKNLCKILVSILTISKLKHKYAVIPAIFHLLRAADSSQVLGKTKLGLLLCTIPGCKTLDHN